MEHIAKTIEKKKKRIVAGKEVTCKRCGDQARIILREGRYYVFCTTEQREDLLKEYNI